MNVWIGNVLLSMLFVLSIMDVGLSYVTSVSFTRRMARFGMVKSDSNMFSKFGYTLSDLRMKEDENGEEEDELISDKFDDLGNAEFFGEAALDIPEGEIDDLSWRVNKLRLEESNKQRFLKSGPRFLPYEECRKWVQAWGWWKTEEEWKNWIATGEKRNSYVPTRPDEYYSKIGKWKGWDHFLDSDQNNDHDPNLDRNEFE